MVVRELDLSRMDVPTDRRLVCRRLADLLRIAFRSVRADAMEVDELTSGLALVEERAACEDTRDHKAIRVRSRRRHSIARPCQKRIHQVLPKNRVRQVTAILRMKESAVRQATSCPIAGQLRRPR